ncbi:MAG: prephenate dehydrogenase/arogenate dehydrogenase family protein [Acidobacteria bacterium]|nr:MAG: prephenate dehydrogenase/arogenate dehydrogenase family protein [Acidobacteriota bacterium]
MPPDRPRAAEAPVRFRETVGLVGFGRFGRALAELFSRSGRGVRAYDPKAAVPEPWRTASPAELAAAADVLVLAVPVPAVKTALRQLLPALGSDHLVIDVSSVKKRPMEAMRELLGERIAWAATHPLFGPSSLALGERPLRVVVCPRRPGDEAARRARRLYESAGCEVVEQDADEHDRLMARSHALAFFVAKGLLDIGAGEGLPFSPPSFQAMARTIEAVRSDASHLFLAIENENPYAAEARQALLDAMSRVHAHLETAGAAGGEEDAALHIPDLGAQAPELRETRELIDELDRELLSLLARRAELARRARSIKAEHGRGVRDPVREQELLARRRAWAGELGLSPEAVADIFAAVLRFSREVQSG